MSRRCELTGVGVQVGHRVSHSNIKTKHRFLRVTAAALRSVEHRGGLDAFLLKARDAELPAGALALKRDIVKKQAAAAVAAE